MISKHGVTNASHCTCEKVDLRQLLKSSMIERSCVNSAISFFGQGIQQLLEARLLRNSITYAARRDAICVLGFVVGLLCGSCEVRSRQQIFWTLHSRHRCSPSPTR